MRIIILLAFIFFSQSETIVAQRKCGSSFDAEKFRSDAVFRSRELANRESVKQRIEQMKLTPLAGGIVKIPVVFHVLYNNSYSDITNISVEQILDQLNILNRDFRKQNSDWTNTPAAFQPFVADIEVEFCLASVDPDGNEATGITRTQTDSTAFLLPTSCKKTATGGKSGWNSAKYLNVWIVPKILPDLLGYATFPENQSGIYDGVVIGHNYIGSIGTAATPGNVFNLGRTATHEIGHWLGLKHIWGDEAACDNDDGIGDTPPQADRNYGCPAYPLLDACQTTGNGVMYMNYMDYTDDRCMYMFTAGQKIFMRAAMSFWKRTTTSIISLPSISCRACSPSMARPAWARAWTDMPAKI